jgi:hypothetical protein
LICEGVILEPDNNISAELSRRHKASATTVGGLIVGVILLGIVAYLSRSYLTLRPNPTLDSAAKIVILCFGIGSIIWRRTKFAAMRLQDIGGLQGPVGLLKTLEKTTIQIALIGTATVTIGFICTLLTGDESYTYQGGAVALVVLLYAYPTKSSWIRVIRNFGEPQSSETQPTDVTSNGT